MPWHAPLAGVEFPTCPSLVRFVRSPSGFRGSWPTCPPRVGRRGIGLDARASVVAVPLRQRDAPGAEGGEAPGCGTLAPGPAVEAHIAPALGSEPGGSPEATVQEEVVVT